MALLEVQDLTVSFTTNDGTVNAVNGLSFALDAGKTLAVVGESGSGKSQMAFAIMGLLARNGSASGEIRFDGRAISGLSEAKLNRVRAEKIAMIFQDPMTSLNPYMRISDQMVEVLQLHKGMDRRRAEAECVAMLDAVRIPEPKARLRMYPHEFSGGMRQRIMIAMALLCRPQLLIADEPTTALDVTVQAQIMELLASIRAEFGTAIMLITHDLGIVAGATERTMVMYGGQIMEEGSTDDIFARPEHPYTRGLLKAVPRLDVSHEVLPTIDGEPPNMLGLPRGCPFSPRCTQVRERCSAERPPLQFTSETRRRACFAPVEELT
ncbi:MAG: ATP-binding cassette domain-containing protein [Alphaproteobacteria bacterium]|nr:ATP-binding cassette domain-containing protein [Alphaproteobacteria bacterium]